MEFEWKVECLAIVKVDRSDLHWHCEFKSDFSRRLYSGHPFSSPEECVLEVLHRQFGSGLRVDHYVCVRKEVALDDEWLFGLCFPPKADVSTAPCVPCGGTGRTILFTSADACGACKGLGLSPKAMPEGWEFL